MTRACAQAYARRIIGNASILYMRVPLAPPPPPLVTSMNGAWRHMHSAWRHILSQWLHMHFAWRHWIRGTDARRCMTDAWTMKALSGVTKPFFFFLNKHTRKIILWRVWLTGPDGAQHEPGSRAVGTARDKINKSAAAEVAPLSPPLQRGVG